MMMELKKRFSTFLFVAVVLIIISRVSSIDKDALYRYGFGLDQQLPKQDDISSAEIKLQLPIVFYGEKYKSIFVNSNGLLSFQTEIPTFFNIQFPLDYPIIAPLYTNVDTRTAGHVFYRETQESEHVTRVTHHIRNHFSSAQDFQARSVFIATWLDVGYHVNGSDKVNTFQAVIVSDGDDSYVEFLYPEDGIQWIQGTGGESGLPDARAQAGLVSAERVLFTLPASGTDKVINLVAESNVNTPGRWLFHVGKVTVIQQPDLNIEQPPIQQLDIRSCADASSQCHSKAKCIDYTEGFCCICQDGYYGNGKTCLKNDVPLRVNGKVNGVLNNIRLEQLDLQSYIVMSDGRAYTAVSRVPREIGYSVQTLQILGGLIGFLFAKPVGDVRNGYQLTGGVFNHTANINFVSGERVQITHVYSGLDVFDQLRLEADVRGSVPTFEHETKLALSDYEEQFTMTEPGAILSQAAHRFKTAEKEYEYSIENVINYTPSCKFVQPSSLSWRLKVSKNFIGFENAEQIIRFGMSNKVAPFGEIDPCKEGRKLCGADSSCIIDGDTFRCVCNSGYQYIYNEHGLGICVDINECQVGLHNCDANAQCQNEIGRYACVCKPGYQGNGYQCKNIRTCADLQCGHHAECVEEEEEAKCQCQRGYIGDGRVCVPDKRQSCDLVHNCSPYGICSLSESSNQYECSCLPDYEGNGYLCRASFPTTTDEIPIDGTTVPEDRVVEKCLLGICWCPEGYEKQLGTIYCYVKVDQEPTTLSPSTDTTEELACNVRNNCHPRAQCIYDQNSNSYQCQCSSHFFGDGYSCSISDGTNCTEHQVCDVNASCHFHQEAHEYFCNCNRGFKGDGVICEPSDCSVDNICKETEECVYSNTKQENICVCKENYKHDSDGVCRHLTEIWCGGAKCVPDSICLFDRDYQVYYCQCDSGYVGDGITECKPKPIDCATVNNCGLHANCLYDEFIAAYQCKCNDGYYGDGFLCSSQRTCQTDPYMCDEHATCRRITNVCECNAGYTGNGTVCKPSPKHEGKFLLLNQGMATLRVPFRPSAREPGKPIQIQYYQMAIGLDVDCYEGRVYWSDITGKAIKSSAYNGTNYMDFLTNDIGSPEGLSVDWVSRNIYWTDSTKYTLEVANLDSKLRKVLFSDHLVNPRGIAVHPQRGKIFWSDWNRKAPKIEWANMDGSGRAVFIQGNVIQLPNSLAIDWETDHLCYADAGTKNIECVDIDSRTIKTIAINCTYPFGLAISDERYYWTDWVSQKIESVDKRTLIRQPPIKVPLGGSGNKLYGMAAVPEQCPNLSNVCQFYNGQCSPGHLCLPDGIGRRTCVCAAKDTMCNDLK